MTRDEERFGELVEAHKAELHRYVRRRVPAGDVDDVVSEVFATAWRHRSALPETATLWLYRAAWNAVLHHYRAERRRANLFRRAVELRDPPDLCGAAFGEADRVRDALALLSPSDQELLRLAYWEDLGAAEIAYVLGGTTGAVRVRLHRARQRLAALLPDFAPDTGVSAVRSDHALDDSLSPSGCAREGTT